MKPFLSSRITAPGGVDFDVIMWASLGKSYKFIRKMTGFTNNQIWNRLQAWNRLQNTNLSVKSYRDGEGRVAELIDGIIMNRLENQLRREIKQITQ